MKEILKNLGMGLVALVVLATSIIWGPFLILYLIGKDLRSDE